MLSADGFKCDACGSAARAIRVVKGAAALTEYGRGGAGLLSVRAWGSFIAGWRISANRAFRSVPIKIPVLGKRNCEAQAHCGSELLVSTAISRFRARGREHTDNIGCRVVFVGPFYR